MAENLWRCLTKSVGKPDILELNNGRWGEWMYMDALRRTGEILQLRRQDKIHENKSLKRNLWR